LSRNGDEQQVRGALALDGRRGVDPPGEADLLEVCLADCERAPYPRAGYAFSMHRAA
jgi:hypothetical protein